MAANGITSEASAGAGRTEGAESFGDVPTEARFLELCAAHRLPPPAIPARFPGRRRVDFAWHPQCVIVETDGRRAHDSFVAFADDRARDRAHLRAGYVTLRFTWWEVEPEPGTVAAEVAGALSRWGHGAAR